MPEQDVSQGGGGNGGGGGSGVPPHASLAATFDYLTVTFTDTSTAVPPASLVGLALDYGDGTTGSPAPGSTWKHTYPRAGTYTVTIVCADTDGLEDTETATFTLTAPPPPPPPPPVQGPTADFAVATDDLTATFTDHSSAAESATLSSLSLAFGDGNVSGLQPGGSLAHTYAAEGGYTATLAATDSRGKTVTLAKVVTVKHRPPQTYPGWQTAILHAIAAPAVVDCLLMLSAWHQAVENRGLRNPLGATKTIAGSTRFNQAGVQNYPTDAKATTATSEQIKEPAYSAILASLRGGVQGNIPGTDNFEPQMKAWGVNYTLFQQMFAQLVNQQGGNGGPPPGVTVPAGVSKAWSNIMRFYGTTVHKEHTKVKTLADDLTTIFKK